MKDILCQEVGIGDHVVYARIHGHSSLYIGTCVVIGKTPKGLRVYPIEKRYYSLGEAVIFNNFVKVPLSVVEEYLKGKV